MTHHFGGPLRPFGENLCKLWNLSHQNVCDVKHIRNGLASAKICHAEGAFKSRTSNSNAGWSGIYSDASSGCRYGFGGIHLWV
jgi:hypothetical protein